jgi:hypothetical protein
MRGHHESLRLVIEGERDSGASGNGAFVNSDGSYVVCLDVRSLDMSQCGSRCAAKFSRWRLESFDASNAVELGWLDRQKFVVVSRHEGVRPVDGGLALHVVGMDGNVGDLVLRLDPGDGTVMMPFVTDDPGVATVVMNPTARVADGPFIRERNRTDPIICKRTIVQGIGHAGKHVEIRRKTRIDRLFRSG